MSLNKGVAASEGNETPGCHSVWGGNRVKRSYSVKKCDSIQVNVCEQIKVVGV